MRLHRMNIDHFDELRARINRRLLELGTPHRKFQIATTWLYGALGAVPADVMFICENPSISGIRSASIDTIDGGLPDIEAQWWGGRTNPAARRFRQVLYRTRLKTTPPGERGGWRCYITNVVKEANVAGADQRSRSRTDLQQQARAWAGVLAWEFDRIKPKHVFAVGHAAYGATRCLQTEGRLPALTLHRIGHYSARGSDAKVIERMVEPIRDVLPGVL